MTDAVLIKHNVCREQIICMYLHTYSPCPYYIGPIDIGLLWTMITYLESASKVLGINLQSDLSNEVINNNFGPGATKMSEVKVRGWKEYLPTWLTPGAWVKTGLIGRCFFWPPTLTSNVFAAPWPKSMFSTSFERCNS